ncbi:MAG: hypothetical protein WAJ87_13645 [Bryobacteraceae bacterium]
MFAGTHLDVSQLVGTVTSASAVDRNDKRIAQSLSSVRLTERLTEETAAFLVRTGAGPETVRAIEALRKQSAGLPLPAQDVLATAPVLPAPEQDEIIARMRRYVSEYLARFPDFIATKTVRQYHNYRSLEVPGSFQGYEKTATIVDDRWHEAGEYTAEAAYISGREHYSKTAAGKEKRKSIPPVSVGEFGGMLEEICDPSRAAEFAWDHWQMLDGTRAAVFAYQVALEFSRYSVCCRQAAQLNGKPRQEYVKTGHRGFVFLNPQSGAVLRLVLYATGLTEATGVNAAGHVLDYGDVAVGGNRYLLPVRSVAYVRIGRFESREEIEYRDHRKFSADAAINFDEDPAPQEGHRTRGH